MKTKIMMEQCFDNDSRYPSPYFSKIMLSCDYPAIEELFHIDERFLHGPYSSGTNDHFLRSLGAIGIKYVSYDNKKRNSESYLLYLRINPFDKNGSLKPLWPVNIYDSVRSECQIDLWRQGGEKLIKPNLIERLRGVKTTKESCYGYRYQKTDGPTGLCNRDVVLVPPTHPGYLALCKLLDIKPRENLFA